MAQVVKIEMYPYAPGTGVVTLPFATQGFVTKPADTPASTYYDGRILQPANVQRFIFEGSATYGSSKVGYGEAVLVNVDGELDYLIDYGFDGRVIVITLGTIHERDAGVPVWTTVITGTMEQPEFSWDRVTIRVRDRQFELELPIQRAKYAGNNALPNGLEGVTDLKGKPKPILYGYGYVLPVPLVNTAKSVYQISNGAINSITAVYDKGAALTPGTNYATSALLLASVPAVGGYNTCLAEGLFMLGSGATGLITCDAIEGVNAAARTTAQILKAMLLSAGIASGDITSADVTALDTANSAEVGYWSGYDQEVSFLTAMDEVANGIGAWYGVNRLGKFRMGQIIVPTGTAVTTLTTLEILKIDRVAATDEGRGVPAFRVNFGYKKYYAKQETDIAGAVTQAVRAQLREEYRRVADTDSAVLTTHLLAPEMSFQSLLVDATAAATECTRRLTQYKTRRDRIEARVALDADLAASLDLGAIVTVQVPRFGFTAGKKFLVIGLRTDLLGGKLDLTLWG